MDERKGSEGKKSPRHVTQNKNEVYNEEILNKEGSLCMSYTDAAVMSHLFWHAERSCPDLQRPY